MRQWILSLTAIVTALLAQAAPSGAQGEDVIVVPPPSALLQGIKTSQERYGVDQPVKFTFAVRNRSDSPVTLTFPSAKQFDIWVDRAGKELYRHSAGKMYAQVVTRVTLKPGETKSYEVTWNQKDAKGQAVGPGALQAHAQLAVARNNPGSTSTRFEIGNPTPVLVPVNIREAVRRFDSLKNRDVVIAGIYRGSEPDPQDHNCRQGPPVGKDDWVIADHTGCLYVHGRVNLDPKSNLGARIDATGRLKKASGGQVYLELISATVLRTVTP